METFARFFDEKEPAPQTMSMTTLHVKKPVLVPRSSKSTRPQTANRVTQSAVKPKTANRPQSSYYVSVKDLKGYQ